MPFAEPCREGTAEFLEEPGRSDLDRILMIWMGAAVLGAAASAGLVTRIRYRLRWQSNPRPRRDAWDRARPGLMGLTVTLILLGGGLGGTVTLLFLAPPMSMLEPTPLRPWSDPDSARRVTAGGAGDTVTLADTALARVAQRRSKPVGTTARVAASEADPERAGVSDSTERSGRGAGPPAEPENTDPALPESTATPREWGGWAVRVGVFGVEANARQILRQLESAGIDGFSVLRTGTAGRRLYFVYAGTFHRRVEAAAAAEEVQRAGLDAGVVEFTPPDGPVG